jgi:hypothetical protein
MLSLAFLSLPLLALKRHRERPHHCQQECQRESRVKMRTEDGTEGWVCPRVTGPHQVMDGRPVQP